MIVQNVVKGNYTKLLSGELSIVGFLTTISADGSV